MAETLREQIAVLEQLMARAEAAREFLAHTLRCPANHPVQECPNLIQTLDRWVAGVSFEELAAEHTDIAPSRAAR